MIQEVRKEDLQKIKIIADEIQGKDFTPLAKLAYLYAHAIRYTIRNAFCSVHNGKIDGYVFVLPLIKCKRVLQDCSVERWPFPLRDAGYLFEIGVLEKEQQSGIGTELLQKALETARKQRFHHLVIHTWEGAPCGSPYPFFKKFGARLVKTYKRRWYDVSIKEGWTCPRCGNPCSCDSKELYIEL